MMRSPSKFSATMIGVHNREEPQTDAAKQIYVDEAKEIALVMSGVHHSRKLSHQQINYSETVKKLGDIQASRSSSTVSLNSSSVIGQSGLMSTSSIRPEEYNRTRVYEAKEMKLKDFQEKMTQHVIKEKFINDRKKNFNREVGRIAVVNQVMAGTAPMPKFELFPQGASHTQILALTNTLKAPDANKIPPEVPKLRKWKGDDKGWAT